MVALLPAFPLDCTAVSAIGAPSATTWSIVGSCCSFAVMVASTDGMSLLLTLRISVEPPVNPSVTPAHRDFERYLALLLDDAEHLLGAVLGESLPGRDAGQPLVLAEVLRNPLLLEIVEPGVECHHGDSRCLGSRDRGCHRFRLGQGDGDAGHLGVDRGLNQVGLVRRLRIGRVTQFDVVLRAAVSAPLRIRSQNESPGTSWVIIATVTRSVSACPALMPPPESSGLPPLLEQAASAVATRAPPAANATMRTPRR